MIISPVQTFFPALLMQRNHSQLLLPTASGGAELLHITLFAQSLLKEKQSTYLEATSIGHLILVTLFLMKPASARRVAAGLQINKKLTLCLLLILLLLFLDILVIVTLVHTFFIIFLRTLEVFAPKIKTYHFQICSTSISSLDKHHRKENG